MKSLKEMSSPSSTWKAENLCPELLLISSQVSVSRPNMVLVDLEYSDVQFM